MFQSVGGNTLMDIVFQTENMTSSYYRNAPAELQILLMKDLF